MNDRVNQILRQIALLEADLATAVHDQESRVFFHAKGKRVEFERSVKEAHRKLKTNFFRWLVTYRPQNLITGPIIYGMALPLLMLDACVSFYQWTCFPIYGIARVRRSDCLVFDRHNLGYLNFIEKFHCAYCEYGNGLMGYMAEILARTEQYFCPSSTRARYSPPTAATTASSPRATPTTMKRSWRNSGWRWARPSEGESGFRQGTAWGPMAAAFRDRAQRPRVNRMGGPREAHRRWSYAGASIVTVRTSFLLTNSWMPMSPSSRP